METFFVTFGISFLTIGWCLLLGGLLSDLLYRKD